MTTQLSFTPGDRVRLTAAFDGNASPVTWRWVPPAGSSAPISTVDVLEWITAATDAGVYSVEVTSTTAADSPAYGAIQLDLAPPPAPPAIVTERGFRLVTNTGAAVTFRVP